MQEAWVRFLGREDPLGKEVATHSSILAWRIPWTEEAGGSQSTGSQGLAHDWSDLAHTQATYNYVFLVGLQGPVPCSKEGSPHTISPSVLAWASSWGHGGAGEEHNLNLNLNPCALGGTCPNSHPIPRDHLLLSSMLGSPCPPLPTVTHPLPGCRGCGCTNNHVKKRESFLSTSVPLEESPVPMETPRRSRKAFPWVFLLSSVHRGLLHLWAHSYTWGAGSWVP